MVENCHHLKSDLASTDTSESFIPQNKSNNTSTLYDLWWWWFKTTYTKMENLESSCKFKLSPSAAWQVFTKRSLTCENEHRQIWCQISVIKAPLTQLWIWASDSMSKTAQLYEQHEAQWFLEISSDQNSFLSFLTHFNIFFCLSRKWKLWYPVEVSC